MGGFELPGSSVRIFFYGLFYGQEKFGCKSAQFYATRCKYGITEIPASATLCDTVKTSTKGFSRIMSPLLYR